MFDPDQNPPLDSAAIAYRWMELPELGSLGEIQRAEHIARAYRQQGTRLSEISVDWQVPNWDHEGDHDHSLAHQRAFCQAHLILGGRLLGAFAGARLVGIALLQPRLEPGTAQLASLHVSQGYRRRGVATALLTRLFAEARARGAQRMYVSATPSQSAVGFYLRHGFEPVAEPHPELFALEPQDIHLLKQL